MQTLRLNFDINDYESTIQKFAPMVEKLSPSERFALVKLIMNMPTLSKQKTAPLERKYFEVAFIADDFDDDLGEELWLGDDN